jgi:tRNA pseudouridine55 synthase
MATGVLPVAIGKATRLFDLLSEKKKTYIAEFVFGKTTDTLDAWGEFVESNDKIVSKEDIESVLPSLIGEIDQIPPTYSAKSVDGKRAYEYARKGIELQLPAKRISIYDIKVLDGQNNCYRFEITCGAGTYIRGIARDIASKLNTYAYMSSLVRIQSGNFFLDNAVDIREFEKDPEKYLIPMDVALSNLEFFKIPEQYQKEVLNGIKLPFEDLPNQPFVATIDDEVVGIGENISGKLSIKLRL